MAAASQDQRRRRATAGGKRTTARDAGSDAVAAEARDIVRRAVGDATGLTIKAQVRQAARNLEFPAESWRPREAFYGRAGGWSAAAVDDLRQRFAAWQEREVAAPHTLAQRVGAVRRLLTELERQVAGIEAEVAGSHGRGSSSDE